MSNLFRGLKPKATLSRNAFDCSQKHVFSSRPGILVPVMAMETVPGDHIEINVADLTRTMTLNTAAYIRGKFNYDFYFVPMTQLWHPFNQFISQRNDRHSAQQLGSVYCPSVQISDILNLIKKSATNSTYAQAGCDIFGYQFAPNAIRILDMLGYGSYYELLDLIAAGSANIDTYISQFVGKYVNIFRLAAYQHIWYDIYRNKYFDVESEYANGLTQGRDYVRYWNFDDLTCKTAANSRLTVDDGTSSTYDRIFGLLGQRYVQYKKDLFTSAMPSTQFGAVSSVQTGNIVNYFDFDNNAPAHGTASFDDGSLMDSDGVVEAQGSAFDVLQLRKAELLQRWKQNALRAGNMTDDSFDAHFGKTPKYDSDDTVMYLGSHSSMLQVNPVESTASTSGSAIGELGATGTSVATGETITFDLGEHGDYGIIMCVCYYTPENEYNALMIDKANTLFEQFDYFTPEFENIGLEAIERAFVDFTKNPSDANQVLGYAPRYWMYKTALDKVHGEFMDDGHSTNGNNGGTLLHWVAPRHEIFSNVSDLKIGTRSLSTFYVNPAQLNNVFGITIEPEHQYGEFDRETQDNDCFLHNVYFDIKRVAPMSVLGLPQF